VDASWWRSDYGSGIPGPRLARGRPRLECQLLTQEQVLRRQLRARRHRNAGQRDDIEQEAAEGGGQ
jgi:hypothetical protein